MKQKKRKKKQIHLIVPIMLVAICMIFLFQCANQKEQSYVAEYEKKVNEITEIDYDKQQDALNAIVEEGKMNVNYSSHAIFDGKSSEMFNIKNIKNNHYPIIFKLYDEKENCIFESKLIEPGYEMNQIELATELSKGTHECKMKVGYAQEGNVSSVFPITIEVK